MFHTIFKTATRDGLRFHARSLARTRDPSLPPPCPTRSHAFSGASGQRRRVAVHRVRTHGEPHPLAVFPNKPYFQLIGSGSIPGLCLGHPLRTTGDTRGCRERPVLFRRAARQAPPPRATRLFAPPPRGCGLTPSLAGPQEDATGDERAKVHPRQDRGQGAQARR